MVYQHAINKKNKKRRKIITYTGLTLLLVGILGALYLHSYYRVSVHNLSSVHLRRQPTTKHTVSLNYGLPVRIQIPKLQIDTNVIYVGLTADGNMSVPTNIIDVGWYKYGALPGANGTAVIAGHVDGLRGQPGVFSDLSNLVPGDTILVSESNGVSVNFVVRETKSYPQTEQPPEVFTSTSGSHLNLITCTGSWDSAEHRFAERLVVFADKTS